MTNIVSYALTWCDCVELRLRSDWPFSHFQPTVILYATAQWRLHNFVPFFLSLRFAFVRHKRKLVDLKLVINLLVRFDPIRYLSVSLSRMKSLVLSTLRMWMACPDGHAVVAVVVDRLCQQLTMQIDDTRIDIVANRRARCLVEPHRNQLVSMAAPDPRMILEPSETFACKNRKKEFNWIPSAQSKMKNYRNQCEKETLHRIVKLQRSSDKRNIG